MLTTLLPASSGDARIAGFDVAREPRQVRRRIGYVPQLLSADAALTGRENLLLSAKLYGIPRAERGPRIQQALAFMDLNDIMPPWLKMAAHLNPLTYLVDALRSLMLGAPSAYGLRFDFAVQIAVLLALVVLAARLYPTVAV